MNSLEVCINMVRLWDLNTRYKVILSPFAVAAAMTPIGCGSAVASCHVVCVALCFLSLGLFINFIVTLLLLFLTVTVHYLLLFITSGWQWGHPSSIL